MTNKTRRAVQRRATIYYPIIININIYSIVSQHRDSCTLTSISTETFARGNFYQKKPRAVPHIHTRAPRDNNPTTLHKKITHTHTHIRRKIRTLKYTHSPRYPRSVYHGPRWASRRTRSYCTAQVARTPWGSSIRSWYPQPRPLRNCSWTWRAPPRARPSSSRSTSLYYYRRLRCYYCHQWYCRIPADNSAPVRSCSVAVVRSCRKKEEYDDRLVL